MSETLLNTNQNQLNNDDGSFVELIRTVQNGKAKLAQAIIDKGGNVSVASSYDQMAQAINNLQVADGKNNFLAQGFYDCYNTTNIYPANTICGRFIPNHNSIIFAKTDGTIGIYQLADNGLSFDLLGSVSTGLTFSTSNSGLYLLFGWNRSETKFVFYDSNSSNKNLVIMSMDWTNKTLTLDLTYQIQGDIGGYEGKHDYRTGSKNGTYGITINDDGSSILLFTGSSTMYGNLVIPDYENDTATENIGYGQSGYGLYVGYGDGLGFSNSIYYYDSTTGVVEGLDIATCIFNVEVDLSGTYPRLYNYEIIHKRDTSTFGARASYPLIIKDIDSSKDYYVQIVTTVSDSTKASIFLKKYSGIEDITYDKLDLQVSTLGMATSNYNSELPLLNCEFYNINYYIKNNEIYLLIGPLFIIKIDTSGDSPKLVIVNTNNLKINGSYYARSIFLGQNYPIMLKILYSPTNSKKCWFYVYSGSNYGYIAASTGGRLLEYKEDPCVLAAKFTDTNNNEYISDFSFSMSTYNSGGYRLYEEASILTEDE